MAPRILLECEFDGRKIRFTNQESFSKFVEKEHKWWEWVAELDSTLPHRKLLLDRITPQFQQLKQYADLISKGDLGHLTNFQNQANAIFTDSRIPLSSSPIAKFIDETRRDSPDLAVRSLACWMNVSNSNINKFDDLRGLAHMLSFDSGLNPNSNKAVMSALVELELSSRESLKDLEAELAAQKQKSTRLFNKIERNASTIRRLITEEAEKFRDEKNLRVANVVSKSIDDKNKIIEELEETKKIYMEYMELEAPVDYWTKKA